MAGNINDNYDSNQIIKKIYEEPNTSDATNPNNIRVRNIGGSLVPDIYDEIYLTYIVSGDGAGQIGTVSYYLNTNLLCTLMLEYYPTNLIKRVTRT